MFLKGSRPLYRSATQFPLSPIPEEEWRPFIERRFKDAKKRIAAEAVHAIVETTQGHPFYTQHLCHVLWELTETRTTVTDALVHEALQAVLQREQYAYAVLWESLTLNQQRFLKAMALEAGAKPFSAEFLQRHRLGSASSAQRVIKSLLEKDVVDQENGAFIIIDRFLGLWIRRVHGGM